MRLRDALRAFADGFAVLALQSVNRCATEYKCRIKIGLEGFSLIGAGFLGQG